MESRSALSVPPPTRSSIQPAIRPPTHSSTYPSIHPPTHSPIYPTIHPSAHLPIRLSTYLSIHPPTHTSPTTHPFTHLTIFPSTYPFTHWPTYPSIHNPHPFTHPPSQPPIQSPTHPPIHIHPRPSILSPIDPPGGKGLAAWSYRRQPVDFLINLLILPLRTPCWPPVDKLTVGFRTAGRPLAYPSVTLPAVVWRWCWMAVVASLQNLASLLALHSLQFCTD